MDFVIIVKRNYEQVKYRKKFSEKSGKSVEVLLYKLYTV